MSKLRWIFRLFIIGLIFSLLTILIYSVRDCGMILASHPCGGVVGWPVGYAEYHLPAWAILPNGQINSELDSYFTMSSIEIRIPLLRGYPYNLGSFSTLLFFVNSLFWMVIGGISVCVILVFRKILSKQNITRINK
jgi:hypothetical protein